MMSEQNGSGRTGLNDANPGFSDVNYIKGVISTKTHNGPIEPP